MTMNWGAYKHVNSSWALQLQMSAAMVLVAVNGEAALQALLLMLLLLHASNRPLYIYKPPTYCCLMGALYEPNKLTPLPGLPPLLP